MADGLFFWECGSGRISDCWYNSDGCLFDGGYFSNMKVVDKTIGLRVDDEAEMMGLDISQHGENAYTT